MSRPLLFATISNDLMAYAAMRHSAEAVGFDERSCRFLLLDNSAANRFEPYGVLRDLPSDGDEPYVVLCHQDLQFGAESTAERLLGRLEALTMKHPRWAVAGNAGTTLRGKYALHLDEPTGSYREKKLPRSVISLDENFLVMRRSRFPRMTPGLQGFHLYGTDLCLNAKLEGNGAYVIDFVLRHLSAGNPASDAFNHLRRQLMDHWRQQLRLGVVRTTCTGFCVSRWRWLDWLMEVEPRFGTLLRLMRVVYLPDPSAARQARLSANQRRPQGDAAAADPSSQIA